jgi:hypothetical protein
LSDARRRAARPEAERDGFVERSRGESTRRWADWAKPKRNTFNEVESLRPRVQRVCAFKRLNLHIVASRNPHLLLATLTISHSMKP